MAIDNSTILNASRAYLLMKKQREEKLKKDQNLQLLKEKKQKKKKHKTKEEFKDETKRGVLEGREADTRKVQRATEEKIKN